MNESRRGYYGGCRGFGRGRRSTEELRLEKEVDKEVVAYIRKLMSFAVATMVDIMSTGAVADSPRKRMRLLTFQLMLIRTQTNGTVVTITDTSDVSSAKFQLRFKFQNAFTIHICTTTSIKTRDFCSLELCTLIIYKLGKGGYKNQQKIQLRPNLFLSSTKRKILPSL